MAELELSAGTIEYTDTGGDGPVLVLLHGLTIDSSVWRKVLPALPADYRCVLPTLPLGSHRTPMRADADLSLAGMANLVGEFLDALDLREVTLVLNDWGGAQLLVSHGRTERIGRLVLTSCEAFDNYPPGLPGQLITAAARIPGALWLAMQLLRLRAARRAPGSWSWMSKRPVPREVMDGWFAPATRSRAIRNDIRRYGLSVPPKAELLDLAERMRGFRGPVLIAWAEQDKVMPASHARRLAELFEDARLVWIPDSYTLIPEDQPQLLADTIREFIVDTPLRAAEESRD